MYEFKESDAISFANHVGIRYKHRGKELMLHTCPYCRGGSKNQDKGTFSISLETGQYKCLRQSCGVTGNMITLARDFDFSLGFQIDEYYRQKKSYRKLKTPKEPVVPKPEAIAYLESRGISEETAKRYEITVCNGRPNILVFPFYDEKGMLQYVKYRKTDFNKEIDKNKEWCEKDCKPILFGMKQCGDFTRLVISEGQLDSLSIIESGISNAVSIPNGAKGFTWIPYCWDWMNRFEEVVIFGDLENGKMSVVDELSRRLKTKVLHVRHEDYMGCKDANEILVKNGKEQVKKCVENAVLVPVNHIIEMADVQDVDIFSIPKLATGIRNIDKLYYGGIPTGLTIVSGKAGEGKSTLSSQILVNALEQEKNCFMYSGELPDFLAKAWLDFQIAGPRHITDYQNKWGERNFKISNTNKTDISEWYRGRCFLYDNSLIDGDEKESLLITVENAIMRYGIDVILLDNLMTAITLEESRGSDKYEKQSIFVSKLAKMALKYNVWIILVCHKRKNSFSTNDNDEVSGDSNIVNLATSIISYETNNELQDSQRLCKISKNRIFGKTCRKGFVLEYDERSKRIYGDGDDLHREYSWYKGDGFFETQEETPFD